MVVYYAVMLFIIGTVLGSFFNVVGWRVPRGESIVKPSSHCTKCNHRLGASELVPILSYMVQGGKCKKCKEKISLFYPIFEFTTGALFAVSYLKFGLTIDLLIALTFISMLLIIIISDYQTMIIPDEVLIFASVALIIELFIKTGFMDTLISIGNGIIAFVIMLLIKKLGDFLFKKESMGGGDIKLMFIYGLFFGFANALLSIFIASFIALPIAIIAMKKSNSHEIPFGPFLAVAAIIITLSRLDFNFIVNLMESMI